MPLLGTAFGCTKCGGLGNVIDSLHVLQNALRRLPRRTVGCIQRQCVRVRHSEHLKFLKPPGNCCQVNVLKPRSAIRRIFALADRLGIARQPHREEPGFSLPRQALDPAEPRLVAGCSRIEHVREHEARGGRAEIADDG